MVRAGEFLIVPSLRALGYIERLQQRNDRRIGLGHGGKDRRYFREHALRQIAALGSRVGRGVVGFV